MDLIRTIYECIYNTLAGNIPLDDIEKRKLQKFKTTLRKILKTKGKLGQTRSVIAQTGGGFLCPLLQPIVEAGDVCFTPKK